LQPYPLFLRLIFGAIATFGSCAAPLLAAAEESANYQLTIAAQPLEDALQEFARQTGIQIVFVSQITNGLRANPVRGHYSLTSGLEALLAGSGLTYRVLNPLTIAIRRENPPSAEPSESAHVEMEQVVVRGTAEQLVATRTRTPLREIPQTVSIISHEQIVQQNDTDIADALGHAPGVSTERLNSLDRDLYVRGFRVTSVHIDGGAPLPLTNANAVRQPGTPDLSEFDHIEVLRGADGLFGGNGNPGATVSLVRKRAQATPALTVDVSAGSWNNYRAEVDATGPLAFNGALRGRVGGEYIDRDYFYRTAFLKRSKIYGMLEYQVTAATTLTIGGSYQADRALPVNNGVPFNLDGSDSRLPRDTSLTADWAFYREQTHQAWMQVRQRFGSRWTARLNMLADKSSIDSLALQIANPVDPGTGVLLGAPGAVGTFAPEPLSHFSFDLTMTGTFDLFGHRTEMAFGTDYTRVNTVASLALYRGFQPAIENVYHFDPSLYPDPRLTQPIIADISAITSIQKGLFLSLKLHLSDAWSVIGGTRLSYDHTHSRISSPSVPQFGTNYSSSGDPDVVTPYGAILYNLSEQYSLYLSYADIFQSNGLALRPDNTPLGAQHGTNAEVGIKAGWREGSLNGTLVGYKIDQYGSPLTTFVPGVHSGLCCFSRGTNKSSGVDVELNGAAAPGWLIGAGYTYNTNRTDELLNRQPGDVAFSSFVPKHLFKAWTSLRLPGVLSQWTVGGSAHLQSSNWSNGTLDGAPYRITQGGFAVFDLRVGYQVDSHWRVALSMNNVFDRIYYESIGEPTGDNWYGEPRSFLLRIDGSF
jgi:outer membrane receptor for ferric coprogen and ferric-rhodotorulic acid